MNQKKQNILYAAGLAITALVYLTAVIIYHDYIMNNSDVGYLVNRGQQILNCLKDKNLPWFYYNDFFGLGYGSSFFYGQLTLLPFVPLLLISEEMYVYAYIAAAAALNFCGAAALFRRFGKNSRYMTLVYLLSSISIDMCVVIKLYANTMGIGLCLLFFAFCIDAFRDRKSCIPAAVCFYLLVNTHLVSAVIAAIGCIGIMLYWFDRKEWKRYLGFAGLCILVNAYYIANVLYHMDSLNATQTINADIFNHPGMKQYVMAVVPFSEIIQFVLTGNIKETSLCCGGLMLFFIYRVIKGRKTRTVKQWILLGMCLSGIILGIKPVWYFLAEHRMVPFFQFPVRYMPFLMVMLIVLLLSEDTGKREKAVSIGYMFLYLCGYLAVLAFLTAGPCQTDTGGLEGLKKYDCYYVGNGEYVSGFCMTPDEFEWTISHVADADGNLYEFTQKGKNQYVDVNSSNGDVTLQIPKLYYRGYRAAIDGNEIPCEKGYSSLVMVTVPQGYNGTLTVSYEHPFWLKAMAFACMAGTAFIYIIYFKKRQLFRTL